MEQNSLVDLRLILDRRFKPDAGHMECLTTGFPKLDQAMGGGLFPGLTILGGTPGVGKSTLALQIAVNAAESGRPVLYFSLEMPASLLLAKAICRWVRQDMPDLSFTAMQLLNGALRREQWEAVEAAKEALPLEHLHVHTGSLSAEGVLKRSRAFADRGEKPLVIIDYLQILRPKKGLQSDKQIVDSNLDCLMQLAHGLRSPRDGREQDDGLPVLLISSLNRSSYSSSDDDRLKPIQISSFKETGGIEYSADLLLGLQFRACRSGKYASADVEKAKSPREVELAVLKNRYGTSGGAVPIQYDSAHDYFFQPEPVPEARSAPPAEKENSICDVLKAPAGPTASPAAPEAPAGKSSGKTAPKAFFSVINNTMAASALRTGESGERSYKVFGDIRTECSVSQSLSSLDCCIADAIYTLAQKQKKLSLPAILTNLMGHGQPSQGMRKELMDSIRHLREVQLHLDCTQELLSRKSKLMKDRTEWVYDGPFLAVEEPGADGVLLPSQEAAEGILPLYTYGEAVKQMITVPSLLLDVTDSGGRRIHSTQDNICLKRFLIRRLEIIRHGGKNKDERDRLRTISFRKDGNLIKELRVVTDPMSSAEAQRLGRLHASTEQILNYYKRIGYITRFGRSSGGRFPSFVIDGPICDPRTLEDGSAG